MANRKLLIKIRSELLFQINERVLRNNEDRKAFNMGGKIGRGLDFLFVWIPFVAAVLPEVGSGSGEAAGGVKLQPLSLANQDGDCLGVHSK